MYAVRLRGFGGAGELVGEVVADPVPGAGGVLVRVAAAGVHLIDARVRAGVALGGAALPELPAVLGREVAGQVVAVGAGVDAGWVGRNVVAHLGDAGGGYAELAVASAERLHPVPEGLGAEAAVAMVGTGRTALGILRQAELTAADTVLVTAAAGGIGTLLVQAALWAGATVVGLAGGPEKTARVRAAGVRAAVDYRDGSAAWPSVVREVLGGERPLTVALDGVGGAVTGALWGLLAPGGRHVAFGWADGRPGTADVPAGVRSWNALGPAMTAGTSLAELEAQALAAAAAGELTPLVQAFPLSRAAEAHAALEARATSGKVVLLP